MVGHDVEHLAETSAGQPLDEAAISTGTAELLVQPPVVDHVVAVRTALGSLEIR